MVQIFATLVLTSTIIKWKKKLGTALWKMLIISKDTEAGNSRKDDKNLF
jgi:hypothetical protein